MLQKKGEKDSGKEYSLTKDEDKDSFYFVPSFIETKTTYVVRVKGEIQKKESEWSDETELTAPEFSGFCVWKKCPDCVVKKERKYFIDENNPRITTKTHMYSNCTIIGSTTLPHMK